MSRVFARAAVLALSITVAAPALAAPQAGADMIPTNARVYTVEARQPWAEAVALDDGRHVAVGSAADVGKLRDADKRGVDLGGRLVLPPLVGAAVPPVFGGPRRTACP